MKKTIFGFVLGILVSGSVVFAANYLYQADEVSYTPDNNEWDVDNVDDALRDLYTRVSDSNGALTSLKNTAIAKAVGADGNDFASVINQLGTIVNQGNKSFTVNGTNALTIPAGYYNGQGTISTSGLIPTPSATLTLSDVTNGTDVTNYKTVKTSGLMKTPTATKSITANGSNIDVTNYAKVNVNVPSQVPLHSKFVYGYDHLTMTRQANKIYYLVAGSNQLAIGLVNLNGTFTWLRNIGSGTNDVYSISVEGIGGNITFSSKGYNHFMTIIEVSAS